MVNNNINITLLTSNKSGTLSAIMLIGHRMGLMLIKHSSTKINDQSSILDIFFEGDLNCTSSVFIDKLKHHPEIRSIENISINNTDNSKRHSSTNIKGISKSLLTKFNPFDDIDQEILDIVEDKLINILGPIAPVIVKSAKSKSKNVGELFAILSKELSEEEKENFMSLIDMSNYYSNISSTVNSSPKNNMAQSSPSEDSSSAVSNRNHILYAHDIITKESLELAEQKLSKLLGPVAPLLVQSATEKTKHIGDLFYMLSEELNGDERNEFLSHVEGLKLQQQ